MLVREWRRTEQARSHCSTKYKNLLTPQEEEEVVGT